MKNRKKWIDIVKGIAILAVVLGHVLGGLQNSGIIPEEDFFTSAMIFIIYKFHMPVFLFLSGYCQKNVICKNVTEYLKYAFHYLINFGIPYIVFSGIYLLMNTVASKVGGGVNSKLLLSDFYSIWYKPIAQYWFLYVLFGLKLLTPFFQLIKKEVLYVGCVMIQIIYFTFLHDLYPFRGMAVYLMSYASFYCLGLTVRNTCFFTILKNKGMLTLVSAFTVIDYTLSWIYRDQTVSWINIINSQILAICMILLLAYFAQRIDHNKGFGGILELFGKNSMYIFLLHVFPCAFCRILLAKVGINNIIIHVILSMVLGMSSCIAVGEISENHSGIKLLFYPEKALQTIYNTVKEKS